MAGIVAEYLAGSERIAPFFARPLNGLAHTRPESRPWDAELVRAMREYNAHIGATGSFAGSEAVIITGQQPAIFTGPLYTVYKAITAIQLAARIQSGTGAPVIPVFWVGSEDHDFEEARAAHFFTKSHKILSLRYAPVADIQGMPMYRVPLESSLHEFIDRAAGECPGSECRAGIADFLHQSLDASESLAEWTARLLARLFRGTPLVFYAPHLEAGRRAAIPIIEREIAAPLASTKLLNDAGTRLDAAGIPPQIVKGADECNFFLEVDNRRRKVLFDGKAFNIPEEGLRYSGDELKSLLRAEPTRFSPNVALRCVVQQHLFPAAAYVAGPGELAYWAQLRGVFDHFAEPMPAVYPRASVTLTTMKLNKLRDKLGVTLEDLAGPAEALETKALKAASTSPAYALACAERQKIEANFENLVQGLETLGQNSAEMARGIARSVTEKLDRLERAIVSQDETKRASVLQQIERLQNSLAPERRPQERFFNIFAYLFEYGWELIPRLVREIDSATFRMNEIEL